MLPDAFQGENAILNGARQDFVTNDNGPHSRRHGCNGHWRAPPIGTGWSTNVQRNDGKPGEQGHSSNTWSGQCRKTGEHDRIALPWGIGLCRSLSIDDHHTNVRGRRMITWSSWSGRIWRSEFHASSHFRFCFFSNRSSSKETKDGRVVPRAWQSFRT